MKHLCELVENHLQKLNEEISSKDRLIKYLTEKVEKLEQENEELKGELTKIVAKLETVNEELEKGNFERKCAE